MTIHGLFKNIFQGLFAIFLNVFIFHGLFSNLLNIFFWNCLKDCGYNSMNFLQFFWEILEYILGKFCKGYARGFLRTYFKDYW